MALLNPRARGSYGQWRCASIPRADEARAHPRRAYVVHVQPLEHSEPVLLHPSGGASPAGDLHENF